MFSRGFQNYIPGVTYFIFILTAMVMMMMMLVSVKEKLGPTRATFLAPIFT
jgi:hypothetical protein